MIDCDILIKASYISVNYREQYIDSLNEMAYFYENNIKLIKAVYVKRIFLLKQLVYNDLIDNPTHKVEPLDYYVKKIEKIIIL